MSPTTPRTIARLLFLSACYVLAAASPESTSSSRPLAHEMYVWQRAWTPEVRAAVAELGALSAGWRVLVAQTNGRGEWSVFAPDAAALRATGRPLTAVVRIDGQRDVADADDLTGAIARWYEAHAADGWAALEIDYDCATSRLREYTRFLRRLRAALPERTPLSITALPAWMESPNLRGVLAEVDASVLQVHSVLDPKRGLFSEELAKRWYERFASLTPKPFWIALPNYGSRVAWDGEGRLLAVTSEGEEWARGAEDRELEADPAAVRRLLAALEAERPNALRGVVWFRLPVRGDRRIWSAATFASVVAGKPLERKLRWSIERDAQGAYRVAFVNAGTADVPLPAAIRLRRPCRAADGQSGYAVERVSEGLVLRREGSAMLRAGDTVAVGWTRCALGAEDLEIEERN